MKEEYMILRVPRPTVNDPFLGPLAGGAGVEAAPKVEVDEMERREIRALTRDPEVLAVAPVMPLRLIAPVKQEEVAGGAAAPAAPPVEWGVKAVGADTSPFTGEGVVVAVLDTGIDAGHEAFAGVQIEQRDFTGEGDGDTHGHGTHCAGTIFGRTVGGRRIGVAQGVKRALVGKVLGAGGGGSDKIAAAIQWAAEGGANVISMSLGMDFPGFVETLVGRFGMPIPAATSRALEGYRSNVQLFERLAALIAGQEMFLRSSILVAAAGNESERPSFEIAVSPPARSNGFVSVAALGRDGGGGLSVAGFSNTFADVSGPGVDIVSASPGGGFAVMSGTSMATPHVAGVAALWAEKIRKTTGSLNSRQLTARLIGSASFDGFSGAFDPLDVGAGLVRAPQS